MISKQHQSLSKILPAWCRNGSVNATSRVESGCPRRGCSSDFRSCWTVDQRGFCCTTLDSLDTHIYMYIIYIYIHMYLYVYVYIYILYIYIHIPDFKLVSSTSKPVKSTWFHRCIPPNFTIDHLTIILELNTGHRLGHPPSSVQTLWNPHVFFLSHPFLA